MLYIKYIITNSFFGKCNVQCSGKFLIKKIKPLQARVERWIILHKKNRASCFDSSRASITVETALVFPIFLCALSCFIALTQMIFIDTEVHYAVSQTAKVCAKQKMVSLVSENQGERNEKYSKAGDAYSIKSARSIFSSLYDGGALCNNLVQAGRSGILIRASFLSGEEVQVTASYVLKVPLPFFSGIRFRRKIIVKRRVFSGYVRHVGDYQGDNDNQIVYVAENGEVYHKDSSCSHICLKITGQTQIQEILDSSKYDACEKCIQQGKSLNTLFVTVYGDCYHSTLGCSGLKRTIKAVRLKDVGNLRPCSRCASGR